MGTRSPTLWERDAYTSANPGFAWRRKNDVAAVNEPTEKAEALLEQAIAAAWRMAESAKEARVAAEALRTEVRETNQKLYELLRAAR